ncbi:ribonuclease H-like domain-containing protein [Rhizophagus irregularis DAOM 181602=DAOM 197198]|nr:ribonuclease H-like domain-containing protein [Rhizophagus irregularis DAOM 181602=DAOM 197198]
MIKGGGLKGYCQTRWTTAFDCISSVLKCEDALKNIVIDNPDYLKKNIKDIITRRFFMEVEELQFILKPIKKAVKYLEMKNTILADCFLQLIKLSYLIKNISESHTIF